MLALSFQQQSHQSDSSSSNVVARAGIDMMI